MKTINENMLSRKRSIIFEENFIELVAIES